MIEDRDSPEINEDMKHLTFESLQTKPKDRDGSRFWAVLIGVDGDPHYPLHGCVSDAELMEKYLIEDLGVPSDHIQRLLGPTGGETTDGSISPTRANILKTLYSLIDNTDILPGDNIIVYFAGNGARYDAEEYYRNRVPPEFSLASTRPLNALCPLDRAARNDDGSEVLDISVREIEAIFIQISLEKGHKITLILDCGHSCARIRGVPPIGTRHPFRNVSPLLRHAIEPMLEGAHQRLAAYPQYLAGRSVAAYDWQPDTSSHVVLAACQKNEYAREEEDDEETTHGIFTKSLVDSLRSGQGSTYVDLIARLPKWLDQTPIVAGDHMDDPIWYQE
ncbi:caspase domain-containing protein [Armillaria borealis]|uniref:Caspase domain-containing protein n=1 Tax=Armillaria borealis TaxID=47425 RepID=A0AA39MN78_9AGAR|nr:caspase domain-containing protein [Armillaria borealis]